MAKLEGYLFAKQEMQQEQTPEQQAYQWEQQQRMRETKAPPPIRAPRGGAKPPVDVLSLASKSDVGDYVKMRRQQERKAEEERWR